MIWVFVTYLQVCLKLEYVILTFLPYTHLQVSQSFVLVERAPIPPLHPLLNMASGNVQTLQFSACPEMFWKKFSLGLTSPLFYATSNPFLRSVDIGGKLSWVGPRCGGEPYLSTSSTRCGMIGEPKYYTEQRPQRCTSSEFWKICAHLILSFPSWTPSGREFGAWSWISLPRCQYRPMTGGEQYFDPRRSCSPLCLIFKEPLMPP